jgi:hypothetical protein
MKFIERITSSNIFGVPIGLISGQCIYDSIKSGNVLATVFISLFFITYLAYSIQTSRLNGEL